MLFLNSMQIHSNAKFNNFLYIFEHLHYFLVLLHDFQFSLALKQKNTCLYLSHSGKHKYALENLGEKSYLDK